MPRLREHIECSQIPPWASRYPGPAAIVEHHTALCPTDSAGMEGGER